MFHICKISFELRIFPDGFFMLVDGIFKLPDLVFQFDVFIIQFVGFIRKLEDANGVTFSDVIEFFLERKDVVVEKFDLFGVRLNGNGSVDGGTHLFFKLNKVTD